ncbi:aminopeptidase N [Rhodobacteraceae bacterium W635]|uniref:aminopeptidase N n=1 Tax=Nioella halotolerans TaxID=2303578 RepID=UPI000E3D4E8D|nr:aminopeptidase N [Rhodobacteraceae bacterium W635]
MRDAPPQTIHLSDYTQPNWWVEAVELDFTLDPKATRVRSRIRFVRNTGLAHGDLHLDGEDLALLTAAIDGVALSENEYQRTESVLTVPAARLPEDAFTWEAEVEIAPADNTALEGLYMSGGMYCTQCEAEGFRKITYYPDRPDVMAPFTVRIESAMPVLLSNGNPVARHGPVAEWRDPWPKPSYLFALVAGDLVAYSDHFITRSGRTVALNIWVRRGDEDKTHYAMGALKRAMTWDEQVYGREYDLDVFNIVAVDDFNMGAMENKGLNIFNSKFVLARPETATDRDFELIEGIIAHEYFHNWTGNRITCRDWFQLCLKEGLTVFRDQQFSGDMRGHAVKRIDDVLMLRARQFREDSGPLSHPVRPESFVEINNFYTATVYEKGAEVIGMLKRLVGDAAYQRALDLYFTRHDGEAATIEDWLKVFEDATGRDLTQFKLWYSQAGTPRITVEESFKDGTYVLDISQETKETPGQDEKRPLVIPVAVGLIGPDGVEVAPTRVLELTEPRQSFRFEGLAAPPVPSILRGFSAPVILDHSPRFEDRALLLAHDTDPFNKWEAGRSLSRESLLSMLKDGTPPAAAYLDALTRVAGDDALDPAFRALVLALPSEDDIAQGCVDAGLVPDPTRIHHTRKLLASQIAEAARDTLETIYAQMVTKGSYSSDAASAGKRALRNTALRLLTPLDGPPRARAHYDGADNMTDQLAAFGCLLDAGDTEIAARFHEDWHGDRLVMDKWFMMQIAHAAPGEAVSRAKILTEHPDFDWKNPNRFRSVVAGLAAGNPAGFHDPSGAGYAFLADWLLRLDAVNPQTAARMSTAFETWRRYDTDRQGMIEAQLRRIDRAEGLSRDLGEMVGRMLAHSRNTH